MISYEYPLNERIRTLLRLEDLYDKVLHFAAKSESMEHHTSLLLLFEILEVAGRADLKSDLLQELERQKQTLESLRHNPSISEKALDQILLEIEKISTQLLQIPGKVGQHMRDNEWLMSIKQRTGIPGGLCEFDLPSYHYWLNLDAPIRQGYLQEWLQPLLPVRDGLAVVLRLLRDSGKSAHHVASQGFFQQMLAGKVAQLLRITVQRDLPYIPEISANKYALNIRFTTQVGVQRPRICENNVNFELTFCNL